MEFSMPKHWRLKTHAIAWGGFASVLVATVLVVWIESGKRETSVLGMPSGLFLAILALPAGLAALVFAAAWLQERADRPRRGIHQG